MADDVPKSTRAVLSKTRSESEAVQALYRGVAPAAVEAMRARTIRARGGDPDKVTLGEIATTGAPVVRDGFDPEPYGSYKVEYHPDGRRAVAMSARGVAKIADRTAQREELTHLLDPGGAEPVPQGWTREPGEPLGDLYQRRAQAVNGDTVDREANYYVYGRRSEREMAMSILKQAIGRNFAAVGGDPVERTSGAAILGMLSDYADHRLAPGDDLPFIEEAKGDGYSFHRLKADDKASLPGKKVLQEYIRLYEKTKDGEPLNEVEREAWEQLSNPDAWDRVVSADRFGKTVRADAKGGDSPGSETPVSETPVSEPVPEDYRGPRIVVNPTTFKNKKDALCVAFNEGFRLWMEANDFQPRSEPTDRQRRFFSDTAYADDELQLRRTILARIATFDTSVKDPTDDQLTETAQFLDGVLESGWCRNEWEQDCVSRLSQAVKAAIGAEPVEPREGPLEPAQAEPLEPASGEEVQALQSGGSTDDEEEDRFALQSSGQSDRVDQAEDADLAGREAGQAENVGMQPEAQEQAQEPAGDQGAATAREPAADAPQAGKPAPQDDEPTEEQARQAEIQNEKDLAAATKEYDRLKASGKLDNPRAFGEAARPKLTLASPVSQDSPGSIAYRGPRKGDISQPIVGSDSPGSIAYRGPRKGDISQPIVGSDSPGAISFSGARDRRPGQDDGVGGGIENPMVDPASPGSISGPVLSYAPGSIESPVDDSRRKEERRKRRDRRRRGLL